LKRRAMSTPGADRETLFRALLDHLPNGMVVLNARGAVQFTNLAARKILSPKFPDFEQSLIKIGSLNSHQVLRFSGQGIDGVVHCDTSAIENQGEVLTLAILHESQPDVEKGNPGYKTVQGQDSEARFQHFFEHAVNGFALARVVLDLEGDPVDFEFVQVNRAFEVLLNLNREEIQGKSPRVFLQNIEKMDVWQALKDVAQSGQAVRVRTYSDIYDRHFKLSVYAPIDGYVAIIFNDITQQVKAEKELRRNEEKFRSLFDAMPLGVVIQDRDGNITSANPAAEQILGLQHEKLIGKGSLNYDWQTVKLNGNALQGEDHPAMIALRTGRRVDDFILGLHNSRKNAHKWLSVSAMPEFRKNETEAFQVITAFTDITDRIRVQRAFEERVKELRCLTNISSLLQKNPSLEEVCQRTVKELVSAMKYANFAIAEIRLAGEERISSSHGTPSVKSLVVAIQSDVEKIIKDAGGKAAKSISKSTDYLMSLTWCYRF